MNRIKQIGLIAGAGVGAAVLLTRSDAKTRLRARARLEKKPATDQLLAARVAAELDQHVAHGKGIEVFAANDWITLRGVALRDELSDVMKAVRNVKAVRGLTNMLELRTRPGNVLALQD